MSHYFRKSLEQLSEHSVSYTSAEKLWDVRVGFKLNEMVFALKINGHDFYEFPEAGKGDEQEEKVYRIGLRKDSEGAVERSFAPIERSFFDMRIS